MKNMQDSLKSQNTIIGSLECRQLVEYIFDNIRDVSWTLLDMNGNRKILERALEAAYRYGYIAGHKDTAKDCYKPLDAYTEKIQCLHLLDSEGNEQY